MPTGYTTNIENLNFQDFALTCARAFGACITLRDEPLAPNIPEFKVEPFYAENLQAATQALEDFKNKSDDQLKVEYNAFCADLQASTEERKRKNSSLKASYTNMILSVERWKPPTEEHVELKSFMLGQLRESLQFDCYENTDDFLNPRQPSFEDWKIQTRNQLSRSVELRRESYQEEIQRVGQRNAWVKALKESLVD